MAGENNMDEQRLTRIEGKLDKLTEGFTALVRMDEKLITLLKRMENYDARQERISERVTMLERSGPQMGTLPDRVTALEAVNYGRGPIFDILGKVFLAGCAAAVGWWVKSQMGGGQ